MVKVKQFLSEKGDHEGWGFYCPGCKIHHMAWTVHPNGAGAQWEFNGDPVNPTFSPSLKNTYSDGRVCHLYIKAGKIQYLSDCFHSLAGQTIDMENIED